MLVLMGAREKRERYENRQKFFWGCFTDKGGDFTKKPPLKRRQIKPNKEAKP
jgi:hypothetical protein